MAGDEPKEGDIRKLVTIAALAALMAAACADGDDTTPQAADEPDSITETAAMTWHMQSGNEGDVDGSTAALERTEDGVSVQVDAAELNAGHAYTMWWAVVDNPQACETAPDPCGAPDVIGNDDAQGQVAYGAGGVAGEDGTATFTSSFEVGDHPGGWFEGRTFTDPMGAEVHVILNDHGPVIEGMETEMTSTYRGGCTDESLPEAFPKTAKEDGTPGPNACTLWQSVTFQA